MGNFRKFLLKLVTMPSFVQIPIHPDMEIQEELGPDRVEYLEKQSINIAHFFNKSRSW